MHRCVYVKGEEGAHHHEGSTVSVIVGRGRWRYRAVVVVRWDGVGDIGDGGGGAIGGRRWRWTAGLYSGYIAAESGRRAEGSEQCGLEPY